MKLKLLISDILNTPIQYVLPKIWNQYASKLHQSKIYKKDRANTSFLVDKPVSWNPIFSYQKFVQYSDELDLNEILSIEYKNHRFEILGSGWTSMNRDSSQKDHDLEGEWLSNVVNNSNLESSKKVWRDLLKLNPAYHPINWQKDARTGYCYNSKTHFTKIKTIGADAGVDVKLPWEFGRLQHLPVMISYGLLSNNKHQVLEEAQCQLLDFVLSNPPRWGVQWSSAMDVSIRLLAISVSLNMLLEYKPDTKKTEFYAVMTRSMREHIEFAWEYREHKNGLSNNHYLANLTGILYGAYAILEEENSLNIFKKASLEIIKEINEQFLSDGGNFESSIPYHFFASEISILALAILKRFSQNNNYEKELFRPSFNKAELKLKKALKLMSWAEVENGIIPQIGDNDSARMLYFSFPYTILSNVEAIKKYSSLSHLSKDNESMYIDRDYLNYASSLDLLKAYFGIESNTLHGAFMNSILNGHHCSIQFSSSKVSCEKINFPQLKYTENSEFQSDGDNLLQNLSFRAFDEFGVYIFKNDFIYLCINGTNKHVKQYWPHSHNDKLSFELWLNKKAVVRDPGSYTYTSNPEQRNAYRSTNAHSTIIFGDTEQNNWEDGIDGVFRTVPRTKVHVLKKTDQSIILLATYGKYVHKREFIIEKSKVVIKDSANHSFSVNKFPDIAFSNGYGKKLR